MERYIDQIEKFLKGQMNLEEEGVFKTSLTSDAILRSNAFMLVCLMKKQKS